MELGELCKKTLDIFGCNNISELGGKLYDTVMNGNVVKLTAFCNTVNDLTVDWLQKIFQYYEADRQEKKQDYTPQSIAKLCAELTETGGKTVYDICAGSTGVPKWWLTTFLITFLTLTMISSDIISVRKYLII